MPTPSHPVSAAEHHLEWNDRLQDWLDGEIEAADGNAFEKHLATCDLCQQRVADLQALESDLSVLPRPHLDATFDAKLFAQIDAIDEQQRTAARQRAVEDLQKDLQALSRSWRRTLAYVIPGMVAGIVVVFGLASWLDGSGVTASLAAEGASKLGGSSGTIQLMLTTLLGAGMGAAAAGWLSRIAE